jgi:hypothetical protein
MCLGLRRTGVACETDGVCTEQDDEERVFDPSEQMKAPDVLCAERI